MRRSLASIVILAFAASPAVAGDKVKALIEKASKAHGEGKFEKALEHLEAAYALDPQSELLYAIAQVYHKLENCPDALSYYERFLATNPADEAREDTQEAIEACNEKLGIKAEPDPLPIAPPPPTPPTPPAVSPWYKDPLGAGLVIGGTVTTVIGIVVYAGARSDASDAAMAVDHAQYTTLLDDARSKRNISALLIGGGIALIGGGVARLALRDRGGTEVSVAPASGGGVVTWGGRF